MRGCWWVFKPKCRSWDRPREFWDPGGRGWGRRHLIKDPVVLSSSGECSLSDCGNLNLLSFCVTEISASKCVQSDIPDTAHVAWLSPNVCFSYSQKKKRPKQSSRANSRKKIFVLVCWALSLLKREHFEGKGDPHCVGLIHLCLTDQLFRRETLCPRGYRKLYCPFSFQTGSCILLKVNKCEPGKVCLVSDADFRTWEWSLCLAKMSSLRSIWANMFSALDLAFALW